MKYFKIVFFLLFSIGLAYALNTQFGSVPALGKFLNPKSGFWKNAEPISSLPEASLEIPGLQETVTVVYDSGFVPHIFAANNYDLYFAQGYVTATHRLFQLEMQTYAAAGRLSEIVGPSALDFDRTARRKGMIYAAEQAVNGMKQDPRIFEAVTAYADGINAYINSLEEGDYPLEYKLLGLKPEPWTILKSGLLLKYMANDLNFRSDDIRDTNLLKLLGRETFDLLFPDIETYTDPIVENIDGWEFEPIPVKETNSTALNDFVTNPIVEDPNPLNGSNNWAVGPAKSASGNAILSNDPHLGLNLPSLWFMMHLNSPDINVMGATLPGSPNVIIGYNDSIAWGVTNAQRGLVDWYKITFKDDSYEEYSLDGEWVKSEPRIEEIKVKGENALYDTVYYTYFGPVMYDKNFRPDLQQSTYALRWIAHDPSEEALAFYLLNRAENHADYMMALDNYVSPAQNFAFASASGDIAMRVQGKFRARAFEEGKFLREGRYRSQSWEFIPNEQNVMYKNPERGFVASANQHPVDSTYPYYIQATSYEMYRNRRINSRLREMSDITPNDLKALQNDNYNLQAAENLPYFLSLIDQSNLSDAEKTAFDILTSWNFHNDIDSKGASYFELWFDTLYPLLWDEFSNQDMPLSRPSRYTTYKLLKEQPDLAFFDNKATSEKENGPSMIRKSFSLMAEDMVAWKSERGDEDWAAYKGTYVQHLLRLKPLGVYNIPVGGNHQIVNATSENHGPSWRMVVEMDKNEPKAYGIYPGGQSGNPGSRFYDNYVAEWASGNYLELQLPHVPGQTKDVLVSQTLKPAN